MSIVSLHNCGVCQQKIVFDINFEKLQDGYVKDVEFKMVN